MKATNKQATEEVSNQRWFWPFTKKELYEKDFCKLFNMWYILILLEKNPNPNVDWQHFPFITKYATKILQLR